MFIIILSLIIYVYSLFFVYNMGSKRDEKSNINKLAYK